MRCAAVLSVDDGLVRVLWNSDYQFSERCYGELDVDISCIRLHNQLSKLTRQSGIYILDNIPPQSYMGLIYLNQVCIQVLIIVCNMYVRTSYIRT